MSDFRRIVAIALALVLVPLCAFAAGSPEQASDTTNIHIWFGRQDFIPADAFETFHAENPNIRVTTDVIPLEQSLTEYIPAFQAGRAPDIMQTNIWNIVLLQRQNMVLDISDILASWQQNDPQDFATMGPAAWSLASHDGVPYGMALHVMPYLYVYRSDLFDELGISVPTTWDEVINIGKQVSQRGYLGFSLNASRTQNPTWFQAKFMAMGAQYPNGIPVLDDAAGRYALRTYQRMISERVAHPDSLSWGAGEMRAAFIRGDAAQALMGVNIFPAIQRELQYGTQWRFAAPPGRPGALNERSIMANAWPYLVNARSADKADAIEKVLRYLSRHEIVKEVAMRYQPTTRTTVASDPDYLAVQPWFDALQDIYAEQVPIPSHPNTTRVNEILLDAMQDALANPTRDAGQISRQFEAELQALRTRN